jgi:predicted secreted protein
MAASTRSTPSLTDLVLARAVTALLVVFALAVATINLATPDDSSRVWIADLVTFGAALMIAGALLIMKWRGDFILSLFGYWWPLALPRADEMEHSVRQAAFGFSYMVIMNVVLIVVLPLAAAAAVSDSIAAGFAALAPEVTALDVLSCVLAVTMLIAALPQAYLAWTLKPLDLADDELEA